MTAENPEPANIFTPFQRRALIGTTIFTCGIVVWGVGSELNRDKDVEIPVSTQFQTVTPTTIHEVQALQNPSENQEDPVAECVLIASLLGMAGFAIYKCIQRADVADNIDATSTEVPGSAMPQILHESLPYDQYYDQRFRMVTEFLAWDENGNSYG